MINVYFLQILETNLYVQIVRRLNDKRPIIIHFLNTKVKNYHIGAYKNISPGELAAYAKRIIRVPANLS